MQRIHELASLRPLEWNEEFARKEQLLCFDQSRLKPFSASSFR
jgi:hypothetical protein